MEFKLLQFLQDEKNEEWSRFLSLASIQSLAAMALSTTEKFIDSKLTMHKHIVSLHADGKSRGKIHSVSRTQTPR